MAAYFSSASSNSRNTLQAVAVETPLWSSMGASSFTSAPMMFAFVTSEDVEHGKPAPDVYKKAAQKLGLEACDCAVFEDSLAGIVAAARAGAVKVALATTNPKSFWLDRKLSEERPNAIIGDFSEFSACAFRALFIS